MKKHFKITYTNSIKKELTVLKENNVTTYNKVINYYDFVLTFLTAYENTFNKIVTSVEYSSKLTTETIKAIANLHLDGTNIMVQARNKVTNEDYVKLTNGIQSLLDHQSTTIHKYLTTQRDKIQVDEVYDNVCVYRELCETLLNDFE